MGLARSQCDRIDAEIGFDVAAAKEIRGSCVKRGYSLDLPMMLLPREENRLFCRSGQESAAQRITFIDSHDMILVEANDFSFA